MDSQPLTVERAVPARPVTIREERPDDLTAIRHVVFEAFGQPEEYRLVDALRERGAAMLSLVAENGDGIVGHVLFSPVRIDDDERTGAGLAPLAVVPEHQKQGIGSQLTHEGLAILRARGCPYAVVLGHPAYYPRFGFVPASRYGLGCRWDVPDDTFMAVEIMPGSLAGRSGTVRYHDVFDDLETEHPPER